MQDKPLSQYEFISEVNLEIKLISNISTLGPLLRLLKSCSTPELTWYCAEKYMQQTRFRSMRSSEYIQLLAFLPKHRQLEFAVHYTPNLFAIDKTSEANEVIKIVNFLKDDPNCWEFALNYHISCDDTEMILPLSHQISENLLLLWFKKQPVIFNNIDIFSQITLNVKSDEIAHNILDHYLDKIKHYLKNTPSWNATEHLGDALLNILNRILRSGPHFLHQRYDHLVIQIFKESWFWSFFGIHGYTPQKKYYEKYQDGVSILLRYCSSISKERFEHIKKACQGQSKLFDMYKGNYKGDFIFDKNKDSWECFEQTYHAYHERKCTLFKEQALFFLMARKSKHRLFKDLPKPLIYHIVGNSVDYSLEEVKSKNKNM